MEHDIDPETFVRVDSPLPNDHPHESAKRLVDQVICWRHAPDVDTD
jgi:hypothetical protein